MGTQVYKSQIWRDRISGGLEGLVGGAGGWAVRGSEPREVYIPLVPLSVLATYRLSVPTTSCTASIFDNGITCKGDGPAAMNGGHAFLGAITPIL